MTYSKELWNVSENVLFQRKYHQDGGRTIYSREVGLILSSGVMWFTECVLSVLYMVDNFIDHPFHPPPPPNSTMVPQPFKKKCLPPKYG